MLLIFDLLTDLSLLILSLKIFQSQEAGNSDAILGALGKTVNKSIGKSLIFTPSDLGVLPF
jgi:hypothetical protein